MQSQGQRRPSPFWLPVSFSSLCPPHLPSSLRTYSSQSSVPLVTMPASSSLEFCCLWLMFLFVLVAVLESLLKNLNRCILFVQSRGFHFHTSIMYLDSTPSVSLSGSCLPYSISFNFHVSSSLSSISRPCSLSRFYT